jgi:hypothetical protein
VKEPYKPKRISFNEMMVSNPEEFNSRLGSQYSWVGGDLMEILDAFKARWGVGIEALTPWEDEED